MSSSRPSRPNVSNDAGRHAKLSAVRRRRESNRCTVALGPSTWSRRLHHPAHHLASAPAQSAPVPRQPLRDLDGPRSRSRSRVRYARTVWPWRPPCGSDARDRGAPSAWRSADLIGPMADLIGPNGRKFPQFAAYVVLATITRKGSDCGDYVSLSVRLPHCFPSIRASQRPTSTSIEAHRPSRRVLSVIVRYALINRDGPPGASSIGTAPKAGGRADSRLQAGPRASPGSEPRQLLPRDLRVRRPLRDARASGLRL